MSRLLQELLSVLALRIDKVRRVVPLNVIILDAISIVAIDGVVSTALQECLVGHEVYAAVLRVAPNIHRGQEVLNTQNNTQSNFNQLS